MRRALISLSDKTGIENFAESLVRLGFEIISTGGTAKKLKDAGIQVTEVEKVTEFPECFDGRVKTLHPIIHGGLLSVRNNEKHVAQMKELGIHPIDLVAVNLYPFKETVMNPTSTFKDIIENIDIGGPTMIRSAAKNHEFVYVVTDPSDYPRVIEAIENEKYQSKEIETKKNNESLRYELAGKAFEHTAHYDAMISKYFSTMAVDNGHSPYHTDTLTLTFESCQELRYGENPHQRGKYYKESFVGDTWMKKLHGKELSYCNYNDLTGAVNLVKLFDKPAVVAVKHACPCGVAVGNDSYDAYVKAYECDPISIFGGIVAFNTEVNVQAAEKMSEIMLHIIYAPSYDPEALELLKRKKNLILFEGGMSATHASPAVEKMSRGYDVFQKTIGGVLYQTEDTVDPDDCYNMVTDRLPTLKEMEDLKFAMKVCMAAKSNAIVIAKDLQTVGIGQGQVSRVFSSKAAVENAVLPLKGAVLASDAFFPFEDAMQVAVEAGVTAVIQPGGSVADKKIIEYANSKGIAMVFTGRRHFKHGY